MRAGKILHCEDNESLRQSISQFLEITSSHRVVATAGDLATAYVRLEQIDEGELDANVVLLDGELAGDRSVNHPLRIVSRANELGLRIPIVGLSGMGLDRRGLLVGTDLAADITKPQLGIEGTDLLVETLDALPEPTD